MLTLFGARQLLDGEPSSESDDDESCPRQSLSYEAMFKINEMRENNQMCDARIRADKGKIFHAHRVLLGSSSEYFQ